MAYEPFKWEPVVQKNGMYDFNNFQNQLNTYSQSPTTIPTASVNDLGIKPKVGTQPNPVQVGGLGYNQDGSIRSGSPITGASGPTDRATGAAQGRYSVDAQNRWFDSQADLTKQQTESLKAADALDAKKLEQSNKAQTAQQWLSIGTAMWNAYQGWQQLQEAKRQNAFQREMATKNFNMVAQDYDRDTKRRAGIARQMGGLDEKAEREYIDRNKAPRLK